MRMQHALAGPGQVAALFLSIAPLSAIAATLIVSGNDGKSSRFDGSYRVDPQPVPDTLVILDARTFPPRIIGQTEVHHGVVAPSTSVALTPDENLALLASPNQVDPQDPTKLRAESFLQVIDINGGSPRLSKRIDLPHQPLSVSINRTGTLALTAQSEGELGIFTIRGKDVELRKVLTIGTPQSRTSSAVFTPDQRWALVTYRSDSQLGVLAVNGDEVSPPSYKLPTGRNPYIVEIAPNGRFAIVNNNSLSKDDSEDSIDFVDLTTTPFRVGASVPVPRTPEGLAISPDSRWVAVSTGNGSFESRDNPGFHDFGLVLLFRIRDRKLLLAGSARTGHNSQGVIFTPDGKYILVQDYMEQSLSTFKVSTHGPVATGRRIEMPGRPASIRAAAN